MSEINASGNRFKSLVLIHRPLGHNILCPLYRIRNIIVLTDVLSENLDVQ